MIKSGKNTKFLIRVLFGLVIVFIIIQLYILSSIGTQGRKVSEIRAQHEQLKIENEIKRAKILELQSTTAVTDTIANLRMAPVVVTYIDPDLIEISAQR